MRDDIGELERVRVVLTSDDGRATSWWLQELRGEDDDTGDEFVIDVGEWLRCGDDDDDGVREWPIVWPGVLPVSSEPQ